MYFDPGTGSLIVQLIVALFASIGAVMLMFKNKVKSFFNKGKKDKND